MAVAGTLTYKTELDTSGVKKAGSTVKSIIAGLGITKIISTAMNTIKNSVDDAVKRVDTLNNFPKVMSNLGIGAKESSKSIKIMSDKLAGLPTTLDQGARAVQRFTSKNNNVKKSTDMFLALNNAILAGGASSEIQSTALEQLSQAYAKGKPDMMEWRSALTAMPAQLNQVAEAMGFGKNGADALGEALRTGEVSMDDFMNTIIQLNENGSNGFQSFEQQAKNSTGGIATSITVAKTQIVKGVADIINGINEYLNSKGTSIGEIISNIGKKAKEVLDEVAKYIPTILSILEKLAPLIGGIAVAMAVYATAAKIASAAQTLLNIAMNLNPISLIIIGITALIAILATLYIKSGSFRDFINSVFKSIKEAFQKLAKIMKPAIDKIKEAFSNLGNKIEPLMKKFGKLKDLFEVLKTIWLITVIPTVVALSSTLSGLGNIVDNIVDYFDALITALSGIGEIIMGIFTGDFEKIKQGISDLLSGLFNMIIATPKMIFEFIVGFLGNIWTLIGDFIINIGKTIIDGIVGLATGLFEAIKSGINVVIEFLKGVWDGLVEFFTKTLPETITNAINDIIKFFEELPEKIAYIIGYLLGLIIKFGVDLYNWVIKEVPKIIEKIVKFFQELPGKIWNFLLDIISKVASWGGTMISKAIEIGSNFINNVINFIKELPGKIWGFLTDVISKVISWGEDLLKKGKKAAKDTKDGILNKFKEMPGEMLEVGKNIVKGLWDGISGLKDWVINKVKSMGKSIVKGLKNALGIKSPSKVMRDEVGQWIPKGIAVGIDMNADSIKNSIDDMYKEMNKTIKMENNKLSFDVVSGNVYNKAFLQTPVAIDLNAIVEMDNQKVGRLVTPSVVKTIKTSGGTL